MAAIRVLTSRPWANRDDLRAMQRVMSAAWLGPDRPRVPGTVGDLEWWTAQGGPGVDWAERIRVWEVDGVVAAWAWFNPPGSLDWFVGEAIPSPDRDRVRAEMLTWLEDRGRRHRSAAGGTPSDAGGPIELETWAGEGWPEEASVRARGFEPTETALTQWVQPLDVELDPERTPDGYTIRTLGGPDEIERRVEVHRAAFAPSKLTVEKYGILPGLDHYAFDHDVVAEAADGTFAAFAICWIDPVGSIGEFEPVGTHPDHQRRGLGRAIMRHGLRLMRDAGMRDALVFSDRSNAASEALYRSAGFEAVAIHRRYRRVIEP
jgi:ribosomal protein S18 acetylase RimI-like enzyme